MAEKNKKNKTKESILEDKVNLEGDLPTWRECLPTELIKIKMGPRIYGPSDKQYEDFRPLY